MPLDDRGLIGGLLDALIGPPFEVRQQRLQEQQRQDQQTLDTAAIGGIIGNQAGPFAAGLLDPATGRTRPFAQQDPNVQAANLGRAAQSPALAGRVSDEVFGLTAQQSAQLGINRRTQKIDSFAKAFAAQNQAISELGDDVRTTLRPVREAVQSRAQVQAMLAQGDSLGATLSLVAVFKALDPNSTVRESELGEVKGGFGLETSVVNAWNVARGKGFTPESRAEVMRTLDAIVGKRALDSMVQMSGFAGELQSRGIHGPRLKNVFKTVGLDPAELLEIATPLLDTETIKEIQALSAQGADSFDLLGIF